MYYHRLTGLDASLLITTPVATAGLSVIVGPSTAVLAIVVLRASGVWALPRSTGVGRAGTRL